MPLAGDFEIKSFFVKILPFGKSLDATRDFPRQFDFLALLDLRFFHFDPNFSQLA